MNCLATDLFDCEWTVDTGCDGDDVRGGCWNAGGNKGCDYFEVYSGGYGGRNYLGVKVPSSSSSNMEGHTSFSNPDPIYVRFWMRVISYSSAYHPLIIGEPQFPGTGEGIYLIRFTGSNFGIYFAGIYGYTGSAPTVNQWYRYEFKISGGDTSNGSIEVRIDGVDITEDLWRESTGHYLDEDNGSFSLPAMNYIAIETYDGPSVGRKFDITGLKVADVGWIGGNGGDVTPNISGIKIIGGSIH